MAIKLEDFRLESYDERSVLLTALTVYRSRYPDDNKATVDALSLRLSRTLCQPGGCDYCEGPTDDATRTG